MSKGKGGNNVSSRRGNRTLAWYMLDSKAGKVLDQSETQEQDSTLSPALQRRKNSFDSESSLNSNGRPSVNDSDERKRRANKARNNRQRSQNSQTFEDNDTDNPRSEPIPINNTSNEQSLVGSDQQSLQQHFLSLGATRPPTAEKENYWYYDQLSDGFFYEYCGSRGWRKRNPKLHGNPPTNLTNKTNEENTVAPGTQTIEKKVYVPVPIPVFTNGSKFFPQAGTSPNIKYYDPGSDGFIYETATIDGWKRRSTPYSQSNNVNPPTSTHHGVNQFSQSPRVEPSSLVSFPPLGRDLMTNRELEEFILAKMKNAPNTDKNSLPFASVVSRGIKNNMAPQRPNPEEYPSSSSTVSSSVSSDNATPPPANNGKENQCQQLFSQTKEPLVGSFEEPYEFYWSDNEKADNAQTAEQASSVSSIDDFNPLSAYFNGMSMNSQVEKRDLRVQRPSSLKIVNPPTSNVDKRLPNFNIDRFIADLPGNDNFMNNMSTLYAAPFGVDSPRTPFNQYSFTKESPMYTPMLPKDNGWARFGSYKQDEMMLEKNLAESNIERGLRDIERIWN